MRIENWPWLYKLQLLLIVGLVMVVANALMSGILLALGVSVDLGHSVMSGIMALFGTVPFLWTARPRGLRHLLVLCGAVLATTAAALATTILLTHGLKADPMHQEERKLFVLPMVTVTAMWGLIYLLAPRDVIWEAPPDDDAVD